MDNKHKIAGTSALAWAILTLLAFVLAIVSSSSRSFDLYDITRGVMAISEQTATVAGGYFAFSWSGAALIFMVVAINGWLLDGSNAYLARAGAAFGLIAGALFMIYGLVGGHGYLDLAYVQSVRPTGYIDQTYLPLTIINNQLLAAALTVMGLWLMLTSWHLLRAQLFQPLIAYLGLVAGAIAMLGFVMPAGLPGLLSLLLAVFWGILMGLHLLRRPNMVSSHSSP